MSQQAAAYLEGHAWQNNMPGRPRTVHVHGTWQCPTSGWHLDLVPIESDDPEVLKLKLAETAPNGFSLPVLTPVEVSYRSPAPELVKQVIIHPNGPTLMVDQIERERDGLTPESMVASWPYRRQANYFQLEGGGVRISYSATSLDGTPQLIYAEGGDEPRTFQGAVDVQNSPLGDLVTVTLDQSIDGTSHSFTLVVPRVNIDGDETEFETLGITTAYYSSLIGPDGVPGQTSSCETVELRGSATFIYS